MKPHQAVKPSTRAMNTMIRILIAVLVVTKP